MSYTDEGLLAKLSALNETQESIVTVAQWIMFHRRHAERTGQLWLQRLKDSSSNKRLNLIYLANEICQQSKARKKEEFLIAFSPFIADATSTAYRGATSEVQQKLRRNVEVWRQRQIFELPIQANIEARIDELDKSRSANKRPAGASIFSSNSDLVPPELVPLVGPQQEIVRLTLLSKTSASAAEQDYNKLIGKDAIIPSAPVYAARLNGLLKTLANAEGAVAEGIKSRKVLIEGLEKLLATNRKMLEVDETNRDLLADRKMEIDGKKKDVEDSIMRGLPNSNPSTPIGADGSPGSNNTSGSPDPIAPDVEALTPPRPEVEALTPPQDAQVLDSTTPDFNLENHSPAAVNPFEEPASPIEPFTLLQSPVPAINYPIQKKRKLNGGDDFPDLGLGGDAMDGLDADVVASLQEESAGNGIQ